MEKSCVLVTGGAGYIGSVTARKLREAGREVVIVDNLSTGDRRAAGDIPLEEVDIRNYEALAEVFAKHKFQAVMHFAAKLDVGESTREPLLYYENNVGGTLHVLRAMKEFGVRHIVFSSSASVYGTSGSPDAIREDAPFAPVSPYGRTKAGSELALADCARVGDVAYAALRYFNVAGADLETPQGKFGQARSNLIPQVVHAISTGEPVRIFGTDYETRDGTGIRDYIHVADLAEAHLLALAHLEGGGAGGAFNLGTGTGFSVREVVEAARAASGKEIEVAEEGRRDGDPPVAVADATRAREVLGWVPRRTKLEEMVASALAATRT